jgi:predicted phage terminase large subunit-like protein
MNSYSALLPVKSHRQSYSKIQLQAAAELERRRRAGVVEIPPFRTFVSGAWLILEPSTRFVPGWHIDAICDHLSAISTGELRKLIINVPPGSMKSLLVSVMWPVWDWLKNPYRRFLTASYAQTLSTRDSLKSRRLIQSQWFQSQWGYLFALTGDQNQKTRYENNSTGFRVATSVGGATGERAGVRILDDPHNIDDVQSDLVREGTIDWVKTVWAEREDDSKTSIDIVVMQRLHERDVSGFLLEEIGGYEHLMLPMRFEPDRRCHTVIGFVDPRTEPGELLCQERNDEEAVQEKEKRLGTYGASGQLQQRPSPAGGGIFKRHWWRFWVHKDMNLPPVFVKMTDGTLFECPVSAIPPVIEIQMQSWDMAFKDNKDSAYVVGQAWGRLGANKYLLDQLRDRLDMPGTIKAVSEFSIKHPRTSLKLVEDAANGPAVIQSLREKISGLIPVNPMGDKVTRAKAVSPQMEAGNIYLPHPQIAPWVNDLIERFANFPATVYKDEIDATTQALIRWGDMESKNSLPVEETQSESPRWNLSGGGAGRWGRG